MNDVGPLPLHFLFGKLMTVNSLPFGRPRFLSFDGSLRFEISKEKINGLYKYLIYLLYI